jgi:YjbE family integral membrane protein
MSLEAMMGGMSPAEWWPALGQIMLLDLVLAGDNAVVIALACRALPPGKRMLGIILGAACAIVMRIVFTIGVTSLLQTPWLQLLGSIALFWIAVKLLTDEGEAHDVESATSLWNAVRIVAIADLVMSLDNVIAIAAAANGNWSLIIIGLLVSIPLIVSGATLVTWLLSRLPILVWVGAALLGWIAGQMIVSDPGVLEVLRSNMPNWLQPPDPRTGKVAVLTGIKYAAAIIGAAFVVALSLRLRRGRDHGAATV